MRKDRVDRALPLFDHRLRPYQKDAQIAVRKDFRAGHKAVLMEQPTGTGKTLAVWMGPILKWLGENRNRDKWQPKRPPGLRVLWITPLRALAGDTEASLRQPIDHLGLPWRLESRTGDSKASAKARQLKRLPTALITTPESLSLMLTHEKLLEQFSQLEAFKSLPMFRNIGLWRVGRLLGKLMLKNIINKNLNVS